MRSLAIALLSVFLCGAKTGYALLKKDSSDLSLTLAVVNSNEIKLTVKNTGHKLVRAYSHVKTYENHYDYFEVEAKTPDGDRIYLSFVANRDQSAPVIVELKPGESFSHTINIKQWAERPVNKKDLTNAGLYHLPNGIEIRAKYLNQPCNNCSKYYKSIWTGYIYSSWQTF